VQPAARPALVCHPAKLNDRPRQALGFRTPAEKLTDLIDGLPRDETMRNVRVVHDRLRSSTKEVSGDDRLGFPRSPVRVSRSFSIRPGGAVVR
jgi:hypothetical protein